MKDRLAIVTGAGSGIGYATALALASRGARIAAIDINADSASATADAIRKAGGVAASYHADVSRSAEVHAALTAAVRDSGPIEIMVNNAGVLDGYFNVDELDESTWRRVIDIDLTGVFLCCKQALADMLPRGA